MSTDVVSPCNSTASGWHGRLLYGLLLVLILSGASGRAASEPPAPEWVTWTADGEPRVRLYFFWTQTCPHCRVAQPFVDALPDAYPWLELHSHNLTQDLAGVLRYTRLAEALGETASAVPAFLFCGQMLTGFGSAATTGRQIREQLEACHRRASEPATTEPMPAPPQIVELPLIGALDPAALSLPVLTVVLAGLDAFNPCAFFVLLFLLSLLVHTRDRRRMLLVGGVFIFFSGFIYFIFMAAWLHLFLLAGELRIITVLAGLLAIGMGGLNVKDYFGLRHGPSLSIADEAKPKLFKRMRVLVSGEHLPSLLMGTVALAIAANSYELLCTAGFPMVYTRALTLHDLPTSTYYLYLVFYNLIYVLPLLVIVLVFVRTLGSRKLQEREGRLLKLLSGGMMVGLGALLLFYPEGLSHLGISALVIVGALMLTGLAALLERMEKRF